MKDSMRLVEAATQSAAQWRTGNGTGSSGSGIDLDGITGPSTATNVSANQNHHHGISVGDGTSSLAVIGGTFTWNGVAGDATTGGGMNVISTGNTTTSNITIDGTITFQQQHDSRNLRLLR